MSHHLYIMNPIEGINPDVETTFSLMLEGQRRGNTNWTCMLEDLVVTDGRGFARSRETRVMRPDLPGGNHFIFGQRDFIPFEQCEFIWMRQDPPVNLNYLTGLMMLRFHDPDKTTVLNHPDALLSCNEKLFGLEFPEIFAKSTVSYSPKTIVDCVHHLGRAVLKPLHGAGGEGIFVMEKNDGNLNSAVEMLTQKGTQPIMVQEYLPEVKTGDKRVLLLGGVPIGAMLRVPGSGDHRANLHAGGHAEQADLTDFDHFAAKMLKPSLLEKGLHFVGLDIIGNKITEINITSPMGIQEIDRLESLHGDERLSHRVFDYLSAFAQK